MSASLVGSEMCIRDREEAERIAAEAADAAMRSASSFALTTTASSDSSACLLYTSDAADDM
eukprot:101272-Alexandrium_andersonii.AAC.1